MDPRRHGLASFIVLALFAHAVRAGGGFATGYDSIRATELVHDLRYLASPELEGRDTPSVGLELAARRIVERFDDAGLVPAPDSELVWRELRGTPPAGADEPAPPRPADGAPAPAPDTSARATFLRPWKRELPAPDAASKLAIANGAPFELGVDFVPVAGQEGAAAGELVFAGFGIDARTEKYSDLDGLKLRGKVALVVAGEPEHPRAFDGPEVSPAAALWRKIDALAQAGSAAVLVVRRPPPVKGKDKKKPAPEPRARLAFRHTWAEWVGSPSDPEPKHRLPVLELSPACAAKLLGEDVLALADRIDRALKPVRLKEGARVEVESRVRRDSIAIDNVVGLVRGSELPDEYVVVGAHYDHVGVDERGRIGFGADDNASGTSALLELAEAVASAGPRRSVYFCAFSGEEDGLLGSKAFCARLPVERETIVAMVNLDMIGRGDADELAVLGLNQNPSLEKVLQRARALRPSGVTKLVLRQGEELFQRSDHYSFHELGIPSLFFFEGLPIERNKDYHTWRDTFELVDQDKVLHTTRFVFNTVWLLSNDDDRPPKPRG
ncbi:MAG: M20/M25/M40 family metallo-hydrolase [Planctomycetes bacterium]|nr:M20/M25/M40 family metallo-hydrolase [Planctomycetota bacterium]